MPRLRSVGLALVVFASLLPRIAAQSPARNIVPPSASADTDSQPKITRYTLPPELYRKAHERNRIHFRLALLGFVYEVAVLWVILRWRLGAAYRDWAERVSGKRLLQAAVFAPLLVLTIAVFTLPLDIYGEVVEKRFGISVQGWGSWSWDWVKQQLLSVIIGTLMIWLLYAVIRKRPRRWWLYFWAVAMPLGIFLFFLEPWVIDPMFNKFEPLQKTDPALTESLERLARRAGEMIPPERIFRMSASEKTTGLNAYVTGIGSSKRIVVWDTTIAKMNTPQIVFVAGHEMGHYTLQHIPKGIAFFAVLLLLFFYLTFRLIGWVLARRAGEWGVRGLDDWASAPAVLLLLLVMFFLVGPAASAFSRHLEHQADQYGLEVTHGLTPDFSQVAAQSFQVLGETGLSDPDPNPLNVFLFYDHPPVSDRVQFSLTYNPWASGGQGEFVK